MQDVPFLSLAAARAEHFGLGAIVRLLGDTVEGMRYEAMDSCLNTEDQMILSTIR
jgi:hypothetical protein